MTKDGLIGVDGKLAFTSKADFARFAKFTDCTVMIAGLNTADQMIEAGVSLKSRRPMVVITETGIVKGTCDEDEKHIYYAKNLPEAISAAKAIAKDHNLNGFTVVGGKRVYDDYLDLVAEGRAVLKHVYAFVCVLEEPGASYLKDKVKYDFNSLDKLLKSRMVSPSAYDIQVDVVGKDYTGSVCRPSKSAFVYFYDREYIDPTQVKVMDTSIEVELDNGVERLDRYGLEGFHYKKGLNTVDVHMSGGKTVNIRPRTVAGLHSLLFALNMLSFN